MNWGGLAEASESGGGVVDLMRTKANPLSKSQNLQAAPNALYEKSSSCTEQCPRCICPRGGPRSLNQGDITYISSLLDANPTLYLDELQMKLGKCDMLIYPLGSITVDVSKAFWRLFCPPFRSCKLS
jgi:hypothetical protein